jgi:hypothetical protein
MLEAQEKCQHDWHPVVQAEKWSSPPALSQERQIGLEEERIIVRADEALSVAMIRFG